ncbi:MAG: HEAT repeat domain-containing protein [Isosphaeraceae bacterium]|nr:HEAT repeat domain-containing protein [Isosphaeraceae bacterium]
MRMPLPALTAVALLFLVAGPPTRSAEVKLNGHTFTLPEGFTIELAAAPPVVDRPIVADLDEQGRLYVADSSGSNDPVVKQVVERPHRILRLEDTDGDGRYDRHTVFADKMMFPEGVMWFDGSLYVAAPPSIWKLTDKDGDGVAEERVEWFEGKTLTGCANDLHGPYLGPDGWIYWCKGAFAQQTYPRPGKTAFVTKASHIFRCRPDGSGIEPVMTGGMDNPVDVAFTPGGERIFTTTFLVQPGGGQRDGLIHAVYGGVYGKVHDVLEGHPRTSPDVMPVLVHLGPAAPCGLATYESTVFGEAYKDNLFACCFNLRKVTRHVLSPQGATFSTRDEDFLVSDNRDFHPTDVQEDADGSLLVFDTGGWYKLCCPTSQLVKPDVLGAVYRVRKKDAKPIADPRGQKLAWSDVAPEELAKRLGDARPAVRRRAVEVLAKRGVAALPALGATISQSPSADARRNAVWAATRIEGNEARAVARGALGDADDSVRQAAIHSASVRRDHDALFPLLRFIHDTAGSRNSPQNMRAAAEAIGRLGDAAALPGLIGLASQRADREGDRVLQHSLTYAVIEIDAPRETQLLLVDAVASGDAAHRTSLIALDQMEHGKLKPEDVLALLRSEKRAERETASWITGRHPEWGYVLAGDYRRRLTEIKDDEKDASALAAELARIASSPAVEDVLAKGLADPAASRATRVCVLKAMSLAHPKVTPGSWADALAASLARGELVPETLAAIKALAISGPPAATVAPGLLRIARSTKADGPLRLDALASLPGGLSDVADEVFTFLREQLAGEQPVAVRTLAADVLGRSKLSKVQLTQLLDSVAAVGPLELERLLGAYAQTTDEEIGRALVSALSRSPAKATLRVDTLKPRLAKFGPPVQKDAEILYAALGAEVAKQKTRLDELAGTLSTGDVRRGQAVFNSTKAACSSCHSIGYVGGKVGPDLTRIGQIRVERDLLEAIVFPSASFVRSFEPVALAMRDGKIVSGIVLTESSDELLLATGPNEQARVPRREIEEMRPGTVSVMPAGLDQQLSKQELADLVAFLKACR